MRNLIQSSDLAFLMGYQGGLRLLTAILDKIFDNLDRETIHAGVTDYSYDLTR